MHLHTLSQRILEMEPRGNSSRSTQRLLVAHSARTRSRSRPKQGVCWTGLSNSTADVETASIKRDSPQRSLPGDV